MLRLTCSGGEQRFMLFARKEGKEVASAIPVSKQGEFGIVPLLCNLLLVSRARDIRVATRLVRHREPQACLLP